MKKTTLLLGLFFCLSVSLFSKGGYKIDIAAHQYANDSIYLAGYYNGRIYAFDTLRLDSKGKGSFIDKKALDEGMYMVYISGNRYYEFLLGADQNLKAKIDTTDKEQPFNISGSEQTDAFSNFGKYMTEKRRVQQDLKAQEKEAGNDSTKIKTIQDKIKELDDEVVAYQDKVIKENNGKITGLFIKALQAPKFPDNLLNGDPKDKYNAMARYQYAKKHYWDNIDLSDKRIWRLNIIHKKLNDFTQHMLIQTPDSITPEVINLIEKSKADSLSYNLMTNYMINYSVTSKVMGIDKLFVEIADRYYFTGQAPWADSTLMSTITKEVRKVRHNLIGMTARNLPLQNYDGTKFNTNELKSDFTLLFFYEPTCGHCKETTPKIYKIYQKFKDKGFNAIAIYIMTDRKEWSEFIDKNNIHDWINAWDPDRESYYWQFFDTSTTPGVYLLDKDKKIIAKKIDAESLEKILDFEINDKPFETEKKEK